MKTFADEILDEAGGEPIVGIVLNGGRGRRWKYEDGCPNVTPAELVGKLVDWPTAKPLLDYDYARGYGGEDCHAVTAWTAYRVIFVGCYDGATWVTSVPRNPQDCKPTMVGGG